MVSRRPRLLGAAALLLVIALGLFAALIQHNQSTQRKNAEDGFQASAKGAAALIESVFGSSVQQTAERNAKEFGGQQDLQKALQKRITTDKLVYGIVLDADGKPLAATPGADAAVMDRIANGSPGVQQVLEGVTPYRLTGFVGPGTLEYSAAFQTPTGERRVMVSAFPTALISGFLGSYLSKLPDATPQKKYVVDSENRILASSDDLEVGRIAKVAGDDRRTASAPVGGTEWRVLLSQRKADLYSGSGASSQWLIFAAFALAGLGLIWLIARVVRSEAMLGVANQQLEGSNAELNRTNDELVRSNGELEQFASAASHDLQEPLRKVQFFGDRLERRFAADLPEEARDYLHRMRSAAGRMSELIDDLLCFSRVTTHAATVERVDLTVLAREVVSDLDALLIETGGKVIVDSLPAVQADPVQMRQLLQNLIANALKFHRPDVSPLVQLRARPAGTPGLVAFSVADNGIGFEQEYEERIFRVFERLHPRNVFAGTGIGLALCRKIAERAGGSIRGTGQPGVGAEFTVELPPAADSAGAAVAARDESLLV